MCSSTSCPVQYSRFSTVAIKRDHNICRTPTSTIPVNISGRMSDKRRAEIEAKRAKLAELRKARADRQRAETERRQSEVTAPPFSILFLLGSRLARSSAHPPPRVVMSTTSSTRSLGPAEEALTVPGTLRPRLRCPARRLVNPHCSIQDRLCRRLAVSVDRAMWVRTDSVWGRP